MATMHAHNLGPDPGGVIPRPEKHLPPDICDQITWLTRKLEAAASEQLPSASPKSTALMCTFLVKCGHVPSLDFLSEVTKKVLASRGGFDIDSLAHAAWAMARVDFFDKKVFRHFADELARVLPSCGPVELGMMIHAFARVRF